MQSAGNVSRIQSFWIINSIVVEGDLASARAMAASPDVVQVTELPVATISDAPGTLSTKAQAIVNEALAETKTQRGAHVNPLAPLVIQPNLGAIRAPLAWAQGYDGTGILVSQMDTGVRWTHEALSARYRGNVAPPDPANIHDYSWYDGYLVSTVPIDQQGHGTHVMGTIVGTSPNAAYGNIGVAPGAIWTTVRICGLDGGPYCDGDAMLRGFQWMLAPTRVGGTQDPRPDLRARVSNNSWGGDGCDEAFRPAVQNWVSAGIFPDFANGNSGPGAGTVGHPANYPESWGTGNLDTSTSGWTINPSSSRGPSPCDSSIRPHAMAPGTNICSSVPGSNATYDCTYTGTSMAAPHVAGAVAILLQKNSSLTVPQLMFALTNTAFFSSTWGTRPNNDYGWGLIQADGALNSVSCSAGPNQVSLHANTNYGGACISLEVGNYPDPSLLRALGDNNAESIRVGSNVRAVAFQNANYGGVSETFTADDPDLSNNTIGANTVSSVQVQYLNPPTNTPTRTATSTGTPTATPCAGPPVTYTSSNVPRPIPDQGTVTSTLTIAANPGPIGDLDLVGLNINHTYIHDLRISLTSPQNTTVVLVNQVCNAEDNYSNITLDDEAAAAIGSTCPPTANASYRPGNPLSAFDGQNPTGTWTLTVQDIDVQDTGTLTAWGLRVSGPVQCATPTITPTYTSTVTPTHTNTYTPTSTNTPPACGPGSNYAIVTATATIIPGTSLAPGSQADDATVNIALPFTYNFYGVPYTSVNASTNGNLQFTSNNNAFTNVCLPTGGMDNLIAPHWDDLLTNQNGGADGIYTSVNGTAPNRIFAIEWRGCIYNFSGCAGNVNFEALLYEGQTRFDFVYGVVSDNGGPHSTGDAGATVGAQYGTGPQSTQFACNTASLSTGLRLIFGEPSCATLTPTTTSTPPSH